MFDVNRKASSLQSLILYTSFHDLINVYSPGAGADAPRGQNVDVLSLRSFVTSFKKISLKSDFIRKRLRIRSVISIKLSLYNSFMPI